MPPFAAFYKGKPKTPAELVNKTQSALQALASTSKGKDAEKTGKEVTDYLSMAVQMLLGSRNPPADAAPAPDVPALMSALLQSEAIPLMLSHLSRLPFETRKDVVDIFVFTCKYSKPPGTYPGIEYLRGRSHVIKSLVRGYEDPGVALNCGTMLRAAIQKDAAIATAILNSECLELFFGYVQINGLEGSDAFHTFRTLLETHKSVTTEYLKNGEKYDAFFRSYEPLLSSNNYATQRQAQRLLAHLLMTSVVDDDTLKLMYRFSTMLIALSLLAHLLMNTFLGHEALMFKYIKSANNLMLIMNLLRVNSRIIQFEAFHVFKVFVANPNKPDIIKGLLISNRDKLLRFLTGFLKSREDEDESFAAEKRDIMAEIEGLQHEDPQYRLTPSPSMNRGLATSMSFSMIHREGGDANSKGLSDAASKGFSQASTDNLRDFG